MRINIVMVLFLAAMGMGVTAKATYGTIKGDICRKMKGRRYYLEAGTRAEVTAVNVTLPPYSPRLTNLSPARLATPRHYLPLSSQSRHRRSGYNGPKRRRFFGVPSHPPPTPTTTTTTTPTPTTTEKFFPPLANMIREDLTRDEEEEEEEEEDQTPGEEATLTQPLRCGAEFFTCPDCHLQFTFTAVHLPSCSHDQSCRCDYVRVREPPYAVGGGRDVCSTGGGVDAVSEGARSGGGIQFFATQTREAIVDFLYGRRYSHAFTLVITARQNKYQIKGEANVTSGNIRSPYFPELYPKDHWMEYRLMARDSNTRIKVVFLDFLLSPWSYVEVEDTNSTRLATFSGNIFRPPILVSSGPILTIRFSGNGETARGFNLQYAFVQADTLHTYPASTDCGGFVTNFGGTITMMNMTKGPSNLTLFDCVWIIQPPHNYAFKSHLSIRVVQFEDMVPGTTVEIRQGVTSEEYLLETVTAGGAGGGVGTGAAPPTPPVTGTGTPKATGTGGLRSKEHVAAVETGFYVRLRGAFTKDSKFAIAYTSFSYIGSCYPLTDLKCHNHRCIPKMLRCDGFDHCGDGSDEPASCYGNVGPGNKTLTPEDAAWWYQHTPNYYFPQKNSLMIGGAHGWSSLLLLASLVVLVMIIFGLISYMFKSATTPPGSRERERRSTAANRSSVSDGVEIFDAAADDPPLYEPPPDYEDVIKFILSGNNLKLVRRPGGVTAWVPDKLVGEGEAVGGGGTGGSSSGERPLRTRHASLDLEQGMEVVLWNPSTGIPNPWTVGRGALLQDTVQPQSMVAAHPRLGHVRRSSLPVAPLPEVLQGHSHGVSVAPETIVEAPEGIESPLPLPRPLQPAISSPQISVRSFNYDSSAVSTPGPSTPRVSTPANPSRRLLKKGKKKKRASTARRPKRQDDSAPPSYEDAMQQSSRGATPVHRADHLSHVSESTQTSLDHDHDVTPTDRLRAAREMFQKMARGERDIDAPRVPSGKITPPKRPSAPATRGRHVRTGSGGGTISRGTVRARKAMLMKIQRPRSACTCQGACSCATLASEGDHSPTTPGAVQSRVNYYEGTRRDGEESNQGPKKRRLVRNKSAPNMNLTCHKDQLVKREVDEEEMDVDADEVGVEMDESWCQQDCDRVGEEMDRPLISPEYETHEIVQENLLPSIRNRVQMYDQISHSGSVHSGNQSKEVSPNVSQSVSPVPPFDVDEGVRPGLVREARTRLVMAIQKDLPRLLVGDSDECADSPQPILVPYLNLKNEASTPELTDVSMSPPPLRRDEAESIELWDASSNGRPSPKHEARSVETPNVETPNTASGAVPKKLPKSQRTTKTGCDMGSNSSGTHHMGSNSSGTHYVRSNSSGMRDMGSNSSGKHYVRSNSSGMRDMGSNSSGTHCVRSNSSGSRVGSNTGSNIESNVGSNSSGPTTSSQGRTGTVRSRSGLTLPLADKFCPAPSPKSPEGRPLPRDATEEEDLPTTAEDIRKSSPKPQQKLLDVTLNETLDSDTDQEMEEEEEREEEEDEEEKEEDDEEEEEDEEKEEEEEDSSASPILQQRKTGTHKQESDRQTGPKQHLQRELIQQGEPKVVPKERRAPKPSTSNQDIDSKPMPDKQTEQHKSNQPKLTNQHQKPNQQTGLKAKNQERPKSNKETEQHGTNRQTGPRSNHQTEQHRSNKETGPKSNQQTEQHRSNQPKLTNQETEQHRTKQPKPINQETEQHRSEQPKLTNQHRSDQHAEPKRQTESHTDPNQTTKKIKVPVPSPRGSKMPQTTPQGAQKSRPQISPQNQPLDPETSPMEGNQGINPSPKPRSSPQRRVESLESVNGTGNEPSFPSQSQGAPQIAPHMNTGVVTIQIGKKTRRDFI